MSFKISAESDLWESRGTFTLAVLGAAAKKVKIEPYELFF
jgi:hypothetical protein